MTDGRKISGVIKFFNTEKGYGFIRSPDVPKDVFIHISSLMSSGYASVVDGEPVEAEIKETTRGLEAVNPRRVILEDEQIQELIQKLDEARKTEFRLLIVGRTGVGKSGTINTLMGESVAVEGKYEAVTPEVTEYRCRVGGVPCVVYDTPGLCDQRESAGNDDRYVAMIREKASEFDCLLYFTPLTETRVRADELRSLDLLTQALGPDIWRRAVLVLTMADRAHGAHEYRGFLRNRAALLRNEISRIAGAGLGQDVPVVAATNLGPTTPDGSTWLDDLYASVLAQLRRGALLPFVLATIHRVESADAEGDGGGQQPRPRKQRRGPGRDRVTTIVMKEKNTTILERRIESVAGVGSMAAFAALGAKVGATATSLAGPVGAVVGAVAGAVVGAALAGLARLFGRRRR